MNIIKLKKAQCIEILSITIIYAILISNAILVKDSIISLISAFCGITYTIWAGKGNPICYIFGVIGSGFYAYLSYGMWTDVFLSETKNYVRNGRICYELFSGSETASV